MQAPSLRQTIVLYIPSHNRFRSYDAIAVLFRSGIMIDCRAFQLKEWDKDQGRPDEIDVRFLCKGSGANETLFDKNGWRVPDKRSLDGFFGESGRHWTPERWRQLNYAFERDVMPNG
jgi:hypothetical protein